MRGLTKTGKEINSKIGKAISGYGLIEDGDRVLVAVSGGKDSLTLLNMLKAIQGWAPVKFSLIGTHIRTDFHCGGCMHQNVLENMFRQMDLKCVFRDIKVLNKKGKTTCFWCSWNRRKALFEVADKFGCNKVALGHHKDDIAETILMNLLYKGEISAMNPFQEMFGGKIAIIRPLCYVEEDTIITFAEEMRFPEQLCKCPFGKNSKRKYVKKLIKEIEKNAPKGSVKTNIFRSVERIKEDYINLKPECDQAA